MISSLGVGGDSANGKADSVSEVTVQRSELTAFPLLMFHILFSESHNTTEIIDHLESGTVSMEPQERKTYTYPHWGPLGVARQVTRLNFQAVSSLVDFISDEGRVVDKEKHRLISKCRATGHEGP